MRSPTPTGQQCRWVSPRCGFGRADAGAVASLGSRGDSYGNAPAEASKSLFKGQLVRNKGPWKSIDDLEIVVAEYIDWFNTRLHGEIGMIRPSKPNSLTTIHIFSSE